MLNFSKISPTANVDTSTNTDLNDYHFFIPSLPLVIPLSFLPEV